MIHHTGIGVADVAASAAFYDAVLGALGMRRVMQLPEDSGEDAVGYGFDYPCFWIDRFHPPGTRNHTAFAARSRAEVDAFHAAGIKAGGADNGPPGLRDTELGYPRGYYAAFVLDPDGNNMEALSWSRNPRRPDTARADRAPNIVESIWRSNSISIRFRPSAGRC